MLVSLQSAAEAGYYRWTDANGVTHFTDQPKTPGSQKAEFRDPVVIPMADNNQQRNNRLQSREPKAKKSVAKPISDSKTPGSMGSSPEQLAQQKNCENYVDRIDRIESQLRAGGYSASTGNRLRRDRRELTSKRAWECLRRSL
jgi:hypothetical protein